MNASKLVALFPRTKTPGPKDREVPRLASDQLEAALVRLNRLGMMGELAASLAHEIITQPIAAARNNAIAAMRYLDKNPPDLGEVREALQCIVADVDRAGDIIGRIGASASRPL